MCGVGDCPGLRAIEMPPSNYWSNNLVFKDQCNLQVVHHTREDEKQETFRVHSGHMTFANETPQQF